jgi:formate/nitrite transporter FocA (FNT family)
MLKDLLLFIKYPYTAGVIATIWICSAILMAISPKLNAMHIVIIDMLVSVFIALIGFGGKED